MAARPITSFVGCITVSSPDAVLLLRDAPRFGEVGGQFLNLSKRDDEGLVGAGDVFKTSANGMEGGGSIERPVIGVLNLPVRAMLKAVVPSRALAEEVSGRTRAAGAEGVWVVSMDIGRKGKCKRWREAGRG